MNYEGNLIRPPSEANNIILQVTVGCSHNRCTFCGAYKGERFHIKDQEIIDADIDFAARYCRRQKVVFLADGDVLSLSQRRLKDLFTRIRTRLPWVNRINLYANAKGVRHKSVADLKELKALGLSRVYMGLESGLDQVLTAIRKGIDAEGMIVAGRLVREAGLFLSVTALLGVAGEELSKAHAIETGRVLNEIAPSQIAVLTLMVLPNTPLAKEEQDGRFRMPSPHILLTELRTMIATITVDRTQLHTNHASNFLPLEGRLRRDKEMMLATIDLALSGKIGLVPEGLRRL